MTVLPTSVGAGLMATAGLVACAAAGARRARRSRKAGGTAMVVANVESQCLGMGYTGYTLQPGLTLLQPVFFSPKITTGPKPKEMLILTFKV